MRDEVIGDKSDSRLPSDLAGRGVRIERTLWRWQDGRNGSPIRGRPVYSWVVFVDGKCVSGTQHRFRDAADRARRYLAETAALTAAK